MTFAALVQYILAGLTVGSIYAIVALGFNIIYNATSIINFAQGEFVMLGGMLMITFSTFLGWPIWLGMFLVIALATLIGALFERFAIQPVRHASVITLIMVTIGGSILLRGLALLFWHENALRLEPFSGDQPIHLLGATVMPQSLWVLGIGLAMMIGLHAFYRFTILGKAMRACAVNRTAASLVGISPRRIVLWSFALSSMLAAVAGGIIAPITFARYNMGVMLGLKGFCAAMLGGIGSSTGAILGGFLLGTIEKVGIGLTPPGSSGYENAISFCFLLLILFFRPSGLLGIGDIEKA